LSSSRVKIFALLGALALSLAAAGCGGDDKKSTTDRNAQGRQFNTAVAAVSADRFAGPNPLSVNFFVKKKKDAGDLFYRWRFDDGTSSTEQNPSHTFATPGYYLVLLDVRDTNGQSDRQSLLLGSWPPKQWAKAQSGQGPPLTKERAIHIQKVQQARTDKRRAATRVKIRAAAKKKAQQVAQGGPGQL
jgi:PKD domain